MKKILHIALFCFIPFASISQKISNNVHNLSVSGPGKVKSFDEGEICIFCHAPHIAKPSMALWNKNDIGTTYTIYDRSVSSTIQSNPGQPSGASILCLSCHDGTIALGKISSKSTEISFSSDLNSLPKGSKSNLTTDLSDDHPISFVYDGSLATRDGQLKAPSEITFPVSLDHFGEVQCTSCHDSHENEFTNFLVAPLQHSTLCLSCHNPDYWSFSSHNLSTANWNGSGKNPWEDIENPFVGVDENGCENCHTIHNANEKKRLLKSQFEENNCLDCHNGNVAKQNIEQQLTKVYSHNVYKYNQIHDASEPVLVSTAHVECADCHNPHAANEMVAQAPAASGALAGVKGIDLSGMIVNTVSYEYELCYRCHGDNPVSSSTRSRALGTNNVRLDFASGNTSYHPVVTSRNNMSVTSLKTPYAIGSMIYCTDCHASDGNDAPAGPHGSIYPQQLKYKLNRTIGEGNELPDHSDLNVEFALCTSCHEAESVKGSHSSMYNGHILYKTACTSCHDPHGFQGGNEANNGFLINFDTKVITGNTEGKSYILMNGDRSGECNLKCHSHNHISSKYNTQ